jgi:hypothetical protein
VDKLYYTVDKLYYKGGEKQLKITIGISIAPANDVFQSIQVGQVVFSWSSIMPDYPGAVLNL